MLKSIYRGLVIGLVFTSGLCYFQNKELKKGLHLHKDKIKELYVEIDNLEREMDTLVYNNEMSKFNITQQDVLDAIMFIESGNDDSAYAASEDAVGCLQIRRVMVDDVNRILKRQESSVRFTYEDRWDRKKSVEIFNIFCTYYNLDTPEDMARGWNGGPRGMNKSSTIYYWTKVEAELNS